MARILLMVADLTTRDRLAGYLNKDHEIVQAGQDPARAVDEQLDLYVLDEPNLRELGQLLAARRANEEPGFLPVVLVWPRESGRAVDEELLAAVDEVGLVPVEQQEFGTRVATLLRARRLSLDLRQRNEDLQSFINAMSHDLRAPLIAVTNFSRMLLDGKATELDEESRRYLQSIQAAGEHMGELIGALVEFSRLGREEIPLGPVPLQPLVYNCLQMLQTDIERRDAWITVQDSLPVVRGNQALLQTTLLNLISNALKYVPPGVGPQIEVSSVVQGHSQRIEVRDNGIGIRTEDQQRLFVPFVRLEKKEEFPGIGLGLATVRKAMDIMGGETGLVSAPGQGSTFWFELPDASQG